MAGAKIAYVRVSTLEQNDARQRESLEKHEIDKWFIEKVSGKNTNRTEFKSMMEYVREGDTIYVHDFSRFARSTMDLLAIVEELKAKGVQLVSEKEKFDTSTATGKLMLTMIAAINEFERANMLERQKEGIALAKKRGIYKGRKKIECPENWDEVYSKWKSRELKTNEAILQLGLKKTTFYKLLKEKQTNMVSVTEE